MESLIDERYRLMLLEHYFENALESRHYDGFPKWQFACPFCSHTGKTEAKKKHRKAVLLWNSKQHSWIFYCSKKGCVECMNAALGEAYKRERWHSGTTGKGHNCRAPQSVIGVSTGSYEAKGSRKCH
jgi:hypothetical protein